MKKKARLRIPSFTEGQSKQLKGSVDFLGINYYSSVYFSDNHDTQNIDVRDFIADMLINNPHHGFHLELFNTQIDTIQGQILRQYLNLKPKKAQMGLLQCLHQELL
ncbi:unnamed protein product [Spirodela intermedia]|uniref:Uncharacterized protein n=1 Tax=Spirodela intermedia TaxID=51605 RepID=A0A7I8KR51_SPIIN|nr:unnamed protein product [Spirodela intermedia]